MLDSQERRRIDAVPRVVYELTGENGVDLFIVALEVRRVDGDYVLPEPVIVDIRIDQPAPVQRFLVVGNKRRIRQIVATRTLDASKFRLELRQSLGLAREKRVAPAPTVAHDLRLP